MRSEFAPRGTTRVRFRVAWPATYAYTRAACGVRYPYTPSQADAPGSEPGTETRNVIKRMSCFPRRTPAILGLLTCILAGCGSTNDPTMRNNLGAMQKAQFSIKGHAFDAWLALTPQEQEYGLMQVADAEMAPLADGTERAMLFVFPDERPLAFWMQNTIIPLDIIFFRDDGRIVSRYTMAPLETRLYPSSEPARYALEARAGVFETFGIGPGDQVDLPDSVLKASR